MEVASLEIRARPRYTVDRIIIEALLESRWPVRCYLHGPVLAEITFDSLLVYLAQVPSCGREGSCGPVCASSRI